MTLSGYYKAIIPANGALYSENVRSFVGNRSLRTRYWY